MLSRKLTILYGSQTGTAQDLAEQIWRESKLYYFTGGIMPMDTYDRSQLIMEDIVIFICSTTGQGDEPDNMKRFWKFLLRKSLPADSLTTVNYAVLGLGDSSYQKFNYVAKRLNKRLEQLGGHRLIPIGLCDDQHDLGLSAVYYEWIKELWNKLLELRPIPECYGKMRTECPQQFKWNIKIITGQTSVQQENKNEITEDIYKNCTDYVFDKPFVAECIQNVRTTSEDHFQDVRLLSFRVKGVRWHPGDVLMLRPQNSIENVNELFELFKANNFELYPETIVQIEEISSEMPVPQHLRKVYTLEVIATQLWDLSAIPRPRTFELLALNSENELEKEKLLEFTTPEGQQDLFAYVNRPRRTILEVLRDFPHSTSKLTLNIIFEIFQPIKARSFSIASCYVAAHQLDEHQIIDILVAIVKYKTKLKVPRLGLCSNWLKNLVVNDKIQQAVIKRGTFKLPKLDDQIPVVMVGPGTGLAPFRSMLLDRKQQLEKSNDDNAKWHSMIWVLFFGCRGQHTDFHCKNDLLEMESKGMLKLFTAFSRDQEDKIYVQHRITEQSELLKELLIKQNGYFLVAGNSKNMPENVKEALCESLGGNLDIIEEMIKTERYQEETWA